MPSTVERRVYFYRLHVDPDDTDEEREFDPQRACEAISDLPFESQRRYLDLGDGELLCVWPAPTQSQPRLSIGTIRRSGLPHLEEAGSIQPLQMGEHQGLLEQTHVVFFEDGIVGAEFNFYGPRLSRLAYYLNLKLADFPAVSFDMLLNRDVEEQVRNLEDVRLIQVRLRRDYLDLLEQADSTLPAALRATSENVNAPVLELTLRQNSRSRQSLGERALAMLQALVANPRTREGADMLKARGLDSRTGRVELFDLLKDQLVSTRQVVRQQDRYRGIDSASMYSAIEGAYSDLRDSLRRAAGLDVAQ